MNSVATPLIKDYGRLNDSNISISCRVFEPSSSSNAKQRAAVVEWINDTLLHLNLPVNASDEELRVFLIDGSVLCQLLNKLEPNLVIEDGGSSHSWESCSGNIGRFLSGMDKLGLSRFHPSDLEYGCMKIVVDCLLTLKTHYMPNVGAYKNLNMHISNLSGNASNIRWKEAGEHFGCGDAPQRQQSSQSHSSLSSREERQNLDSKFKRTLHTPVMADPSAASGHHVGHRFQQVFQVKQGSYADLLPTKVSEAVKSNRLDNAPTHSLLSVVNGILDESTERKNGGVPERVACLLRKVIQEIEMRISTQAEHLRMQSDLFKAREDKYQSRIRDLEALATGTREETEAIFMNPVRHIKNEKSNIQEKMKSGEQEIPVLKQEPEAAPVAYELHCWQMRTDEHDVVPLMKERDEANQKIAILQHELEAFRKAFEKHCSQIKINEDDVARLMKENDDASKMIAILKLELETARNMYEQQFSQMKTDEHSVVKLVKEKDDVNREIAVLKEELEATRKTSEHYSEMNSDDDDLDRLMKEKNDAMQEIAVLKKELEAVQNSSEQQCLVMKTEEHDVTRSMKEKNDAIQEIAVLKKELEAHQNSYEQQCLLLKTEEHDVTRLMKEKNDAIQEIAALKKELEAVQNSSEQQCLVMKTEEHDVTKLMKEKNDAIQEIADLKKELEAVQKSYEQQCLQMKTEKHDVTRSMKENNDAIQEITVLKKELEAVQNSSEQQRLLMKTEEHDVTRLMKEKNDDIQEIAVLKKELEAVQNSYEQQCLLMKTEERDVTKLMKEKNDAIQEIADLKKELEAVQNSYEQQCLVMKTEEHDVTRLMKEKNDAIQEIADLKKELEAVQKSYEQQCLQMKTEEHNMARLMKEKGDADQEISVLKQEFEEAKKTYEQNCLQMKTETSEVQRSLEERLKEITSLEERLKEVSNHFTESRNRVQELEEFSAAKSQQWSKIQHIYQIFTEFQLGALRELRFSSQSIRQEVSKTQKIYSEEFNQLGVKMRSLEDAAANYPVVLAENRKLHNEVQELKGNIRVYCRVRPFLPKQKDKQTIVEYVGDNGELIVMNPSKQAKEGRRSFKFNRVYGPSATQAQVFADIQPLIQSVLDGYNVCIFAYGQTGSGKTYTMTGPDGATEENWGVNYRALNDLFRISQTRGSAFSYEVIVQMVEIYNEQVRDLLSSDGSQKRLGILNTSQPNGLAVPDASMFPVNKPSDVLDLMNIGLKSRAKSSTSMNERSSRSHSILTIHVRGMDKKSGSSMNGSLHLVDLAGSERIDRSEVTGDRLKEAQHINKSLAALGDVISALSTKSPHVPYRNSKLTQVLQSSLGHISQGHNSCKR
ncbi:PREDICTED: kinesin-like protein KIN-14P isoform X2 [Ipomoea nil]|uniref:kinesin-like protein KIN-14P isoform X2 n=1 Tax=Ipomoea nil TaxID=35883 RepID=UPI0009008C6E|nr:PREDICTED: kinesin-like protein KIN-14P isoform X2 [Ipomoea nil]